MNDNHQNTKSTKIIPTIIPNSLYYCGIKHQLDLLFKDTNHIKYLVKYCTLDLFLIIMNECVYYQLKATKTYSLKYWLQNWDDTLTVSQNGRYIYTNHQLIDIVTDKIINTDTDNFNTNVYIKNNGEIIFNIFCLTGPNKQEKTMHDDYSVIHSCNIKSLTQISFDTIMKNSINIINNRGSTDSNYHYLLGQMMKYFDNDYMIMLEFPKTKIYHKESNKWICKVECNSVQYIRIICKHSIYIPNIFDNIIKTTLTTSNICDSLILNPDGKFILIDDIHKYGLSGFFSVLYTITGIKIPDNRIFMDKYDSWKWINNHDFICYRKHGVDKITIKEENDKFTIQKTIMVDISEELESQRTKQNKSFPIVSTIIYDSEYHPIFLIKNAEFQHINNDNVLIWCNDESLNGTIDIAKYFTGKINDDIVYCYDKRDYPYSHIHKLKPGLYILNLKSRQIINLNNSHITENLLKITPYGFVVIHNKKIFIYNFYAHTINSTNNYSNNYIIDKQQYQIEMKKIFNSSQ